MYTLNFPSQLNGCENRSVLFNFSPPPPPKKKKDYENKCSFTLGPSQTSKKALSNPGIFRKHMTNVRFYIFHLNFS